MLKAFVAVVVVVGSWIGAFRLFADYMMVHGNNSIPLVCALAAAFAAAGTAACLVRWIMK